MLVELVLSCRIYLKRGKEVREEDIPDDQRKNKEIQEKKREMRREDSFKGMVHSVLLLLLLFQLYAFAYSLCERGRGDGHKNLADELGCR